MAQYFLAGVGVADLFDENDNLFATAKTLTDSSMNVTVSNEEVRGGEGAALLGKYFHTTGLTFTMTDAMFSIKYLAANVGASIEKGADIMANETHTGDANNKITLDHAAVKLGCDGAPYAWVTIAGKDEWVTKAVVNGNEITDGIVKDEKYCVKYMYDNENVEKIQINTQFIPSTLYVILTASLFAGDAKSKVGTKVGKVVIKIPRFQLNGEQEISMNMTGASTTNISGSALAVECSEDCETNAYYAEIIEVIEGAVWYDGAIGLAVDQAERTIPAAQGTKAGAPDVYAVYGNAIPKKIDANTLAQTVGYEDVGGTKTPYHTKFVYTIVSGNPSVGDPYFSINENTGEVTILKSAEGVTGVFQVSLCKTDTHGDQIGDLVTTFSVSGAVPTP